MIRRCTSIALILASVPASADVLLTGIVEDVDAQTIEMPSLPGGWQRRVEWMAQEGSEVAIGDVVVRVDPGDLISQEEQARTDLDKIRLSSERRIDELRLEVLDMRKTLAQAESDARIAELDAGIPQNTIPLLDYERYQLTFETARKSLIRSQAELLNKEAELEDAIRESELEVRQAEAAYERIRLALDATEIRAQKSGFIIYGENRWTGRKVFPGDTLFSGFRIASIASREDLQIRFWVHEADILEVRDGGDVDVIADAQGSESFNAEISWLSSPAINREDWSGSGYFQALAMPTNGIPENVMPGMSVMGLLVRREND